MEKTHLGNDDEKSVAVAKGELFANGELRVVGQTSNQSSYIVKIVHPPRNGTAHTSTIEIPTAVIESTTPKLVSFLAARAPIRGKQGEWPARGMDAVLAQWIKDTAPDGCVEVRRVMGWVDGVFFGDTTWIDGHEIDETRLVCLGGEESEYGTPKLIPDLRKASRSWRSVFHFLQKGAGESAALLFRSLAPAVTSLLSSCNDDVLAKAQIRAPVLWLHGPSGRGKTYATQIANVVNGTFEYVLQWQLSSDNRRGLIEFVEQHGGLTLIAHDVERQRTWWKTVDSDIFIVIDGTRLPTCPKGKVYRWLHGMIFTSNQAVSRITDAAIAARVFQISFDERAIFLDLEELAAFEDAKKKANGCILALREEMPRGEAFRRRIQEEIDAFKQHLKLEVHHLSSLAVFSVGLEAVMAASLRGGASTGGGAARGEGAANGVEGSSGEEEDSDDDEDLVAGDDGGDGYDAEETKGKIREFIVEQTRAHIDSVTHGEKPRNFEDALVASGKIIEKMSPNRFFVAKFGLGKKRGIVFALSTVGVNEMAVEVGMQTEDILKMAKDDSAKGFVEGLNVRRVRVEKVRLFFEQREIPHPLEEIGAHVMRDHGSRPKTRRIVRRTLPTFETHPR